MSFLNVNYNEAGSSFDPIKPGEYEAFFSEVKVTTAKSSGNPMLKCTLTIREDVAQEFQKRKIWDNLVASDKAMFRFQQVAKALQFPEGQKINSIEEFANMIRFQPVRIKVVNREEEYNGEKRIRENVQVYSQTAQPMRGAGKPPAGTNPFDNGGLDPFAGDGNPINDEAIPF